MAKNPKTEKNLEEQLEELSKIIASLESGDLPLEEALSKFETGIMLSKNCQNILENAKQKVEQLTADVAK